MFLSRFFVKYFLLETLSANIDMLMYVRAPDYSDANHHGNIINYIPSIYNWRSTFFLWAHPNFCLGHLAIQAAVCSSPKYKIFHPFHHHRKNSVPSSSLHFLMCTHWFSPLCLWEVDTTPNGLNSLYHNFHVFAL